MRFLFFTTIVIAAFWASAQAVETTPLADDFFVIRRSEARPTRRLAPNETCRDLIRASICLVDPPQEGQKPYQRKCLPSDFDFAPAFERLYDRFPSHLQKMFCHLERIFIEKDFVGSAYGGLFQNENDEVTGGILGIREEFLRNPSTLDAWASWKEQIHFGADPGHVNTRPDLPQVRTSMNGDPTDMLYFLVAHEFGHLLDFTNRVNHPPSCKDLPGRRDCARPSWDLLSWKDGEPLPRNDFPLRKALCYYFCEGHFIVPSRQDELYSDLQKTNFLTPYATRFASEDFADSSALYTIATERAASYRLATSHLRYDVIARLWSADLEGKRNFLRDFLASSYRYPGEPGPGKFSPVFGEN